MPFFKGTAGKAGGAMWRRLFRGVRGETSDAEKRKKAKLKKRRQRARLRKSSGAVKTRKKARKKAAVKGRR